MRHHAKFRGDRLNKLLLRYDDSQFFKMATVLRFAQLLYACCVHHSRRLFWWSLSLCKINLVGIGASFDNMQLLLFWNLGFKMPIHDPKKGAFGHLTPKWEAASTRPKRHFRACAVTRHIGLTYRWSKSVYWCGIGAIPTIKYTSFSGRRQTRTMRCVTPQCCTQRWTLGATENAGVENAIRSKLQGRKMRE